MSTAEVTAATAAAVPTTVAGPELVVVNATTAISASTMTVSGVSKTVETVPVTVTSGGKDNIIVVMNQIDSGGGGGQGVATATAVSADTTAGGVKMITKPLTMLPPGATVVKKVVKVKAGGGVGAAVTAAAAQLGKRNIVIASRPGMNQIIACPQMAGQQPSVGSTPVILTQKVAAGGVVTSPVVSTGGLNVTQLGGAKVVVAGTAVSVGQNQAVAVAQQLPQPQQQPRVQEVRVDNWANFCIQRLNNMYEKGEWCDLTLRFHSSQELKVHRVVVNICTEYFSNLEKLYGLTDGTLILPKDAEYQTMHTIIKFFYTGKLDVRVGQFNDIYRTVKMMNITILIKLLEAHSRKPVAPLKKDAAGRSVMVQKAVDLGKGQKGQVQIQVANAAQSPQSPVIALPVSGSKGLQVTSPGVKLPPGVKTKTVLARVQAQAGKTTPVSTKSTSKKLPIWNKERRYVSEPSEPPPLEKWKIKEEEPARPTRFEWGDPDEPDPFLSPGLTNHALMEKQKEKHFTPSPSHRKAEDIFDSVKNLQSHEDMGEQEPSTSTVSQPQPSTSGGIKRPLESSSAESPTPKNPKMEAKSPELSDAEETVMDEITTSAAEEVIISDLPPELEEADAGTETETSTALEGTEEVEDPVPSTGEETTPPLTPVEKKPTSILKPALKSPLKSGADGKEKSSPPKTVRFAADVEKENNEKTGLPLPTSPAPTSSGKIELPISSNDAACSDPISNHSRIISEVLRKFPDLVKDNKNIKLKIVQKTVDNSGGSPGTSASGKEQKSKISYIMLKSPGATDASTSTTVLKKNTGSSSVSKFWDTDKTPKKPSPAENMTGPWLCETCGEGENTAIQFETYYNFRRHLVDVHGERIDARICEYCGQKASKRNLLLYHMYTKHGVQPPKNCTFPHCDRCDYVALSESLLNKHKQNHDVNKEFSCSICSASFKSAAQLQAHMSANLHRNKDTKVYECPYCRKPFVRNINLKAHIRSLHRDVARYEEMEDPRLPPDEQLANRILLGSGGKRRQFPSILATARSSSAASGSMVEFITSDSLAGQTVSYVTADGQPIEILDTSQLTSLPLTLVSSGEDGITTMSAPMESVESQVSTVGTSEYVTSVSTQQVQSEPVYVMESGAQNSGAVEIDMTNVGLLAPDGTMVYEGEDQSQNFIVQDIQGNQYRRITGIDETGKPVVFLQMIENDQMAPQIIDGNQVVETTTSGSSQMFVSSESMQLPVSTEAGDGQVAQQMIFATASDGAILEMVPSSESHQVVMSEAVLTQDGHHHEQMEVDHQSHQHFQLVQQSNEVEMGQPVQELQLVLDHQETQVDGQQEGVHIVEVPQSEESYSELQAEGATYIELGQTENTEEEVEDSNEQTEEETEEMDDTQQLEIDESSQPLQIDEDHSVLKLESMESTQQIDISNEDTEIVTEENLQESIELVEGQTLTLIEEDDGTQTIKVGGSVEEVTS